MQLDDLNVQPGVDSLKFAMKMYTFQTYLGITLIERKRTAQFSWQDQPPL